MNVNKLALTLIGSIFFLNPVFALSGSTTANGFPWPASKAELDKAVKQLQGQISTIDDNVSREKAEIDVSVKNLQDQITNIEINVSSAIVETNATVKNLQDQIIAIKNAQSHTYSVGERALGGIVILVTPEGQHGLVMAETDILHGHDGITWFEVHNHVNDPANYVGTISQNYYDWRLPTANELLDECKRNPQAFAANRNYWTNDVTEFGAMQMSDHYPWFKVKLLSVMGGQCQVNDSSYKINIGGKNVYVRPVRSF